MATILSSSAKAIFAAGPAFDVAQAMIVTAWNLAIAGGALLGGTLLDQFGATSLPWVACMLLVMASTNRPTSCRDALPA
ncbi:hypothetical protein JQK15_20875 [Sphingobium sp. BHU LFT2]|uniref:hypothetical protein n=1 Tax=Sphingobium sp. BHU LFT2 TaxID=2807634 RepID=UPI001BEAD7E7|nr:hypothetical protein [Sphingobium sp. BHU LFT2]MBT2245969.1 hypothetical protein [Sphingobium sp. BHU LFT2]